MNFLITLLLKATLCLVLTALLYLVTRTVSASLRHWIISLSLIGLLVLPFSSSVLPEWKVETKVAQLLPNIDETSTEEQLAPSPTFSMQQPDQLSAQIARASDPAPNLQLQMISRQSSTPKSRLSLLMVISIVWTMGSLFFLGRLIWGIRSTVRLTRTASPLIGNLPRNLAAGTKVAYHSSIKSPMTWGISRPYILLPEQAKNWSKDTMEVVLLHEMTHIRRQDYLIHILSWISVSLYWFHPLVWWFKRLQSEEREKACDEQVLKAGLAKATYAEQLVQVAKYLSPNASAIQYAIPMAQQSQIKGRILSILGFNVDRFFFSKWKQFRWAATYVLAILLLASFTPVEPVQIMELVNEDHPLTQMLKEEQARIESDEQIQREQATITPQIESSATTFSIPTPLEELPELKSLAVKSLDRKASTSSFVALPIHSPNFSANLSSNTEPEGIYGKWVEGKSTFEVWAIGEYKSFPDFPYLEVKSPESMIIIRERKKNKEYLMQITKAPYDGGMVIDWLNGKINAWNGGYRTGDPIYLFFVDDEWKFFGKSKARWLSEHLAEINNKLMAAPYEKGWAKINSSDNMVQRQKELKEMHYVPYGELPTNFFESLPYWKNMRDLENPPFDYSALPLYSPSPSATVGKKGERKVGGTRKSNSSTGGNAMNDGQKFGRIIRNIPGGSKATQFNFHLKYNQFEALHFELQLYQVQNEAVVAKLHEQPIQVKATGKDWIVVSLMDQDIILTEDVLVILELRQRDGRKGEGHILFSQTTGPYQNLHESSGKEWGFWESNFAFYLDVNP